MAVFGGQKNSERRGIPNGIKMLLLVAILLGFYIKKCYNDYQKESLVFHDIKIEEQSDRYADISFYVKNESSVDHDVPIYVALFTEDGKEIASRITKRFKFKGGEDVKKVLRLQYQVRLLDTEKLADPVIKVYKSKGLTDID